VAAAFAAFLGSFVFPPTPQGGKEAKRVAVQAAAYVRVSSRGQDDRTQRSAIRRAAAARGDVVGVWFAEKASATRLDRPELERLREAARGGGVRRLYVFRVDRLTRTGIRDTLAIVDEFRRHGVELVSIADGFDLQGPAAEIVLAVMGWAAQMERAALGERISHARERVAAAGGAWGRPRKMTHELAEKVRVLKVNGKSIRQISVALKVPRSTVGDAIKSQAESTNGSTVDQVRAVRKTYPSRPLALRPKTALKNSDPPPSE
jgi:DNA invertase Pin-like site-specific DNA recombinase